MPLPIQSAKSAKPSVQFKSLVQFKWTDRIVEDEEDDDEISIGSSKLQVKDHTGMVELALLDVSFINMGSYLKVNFTKSGGKLDVLVITSLSLKIRFSGSSRLCDFECVDKCVEELRSNQEFLRNVRWMRRNLSRDDLDKLVEISLDFKFEHIEEPGTYVPPDKEPTIKESIQNVCFSSEFSDIKIICEGKEFPCHKLILCLRSSVFKRMFSSDLKISNAKDESTLTIEDVSADTMETFLEFLYTDDLKVNEINTKLLLVADKYDFKRLVNICVNHFGNIIDTKNAMEIAFTAYLVNNEELLKKASRFIINHAGAIKKPEQWDRIKKGYPHIATKVMDLIIFDKDEVLDPAKKKRKV